MKKIVLILAIIATSFFGKTSMANIVHVVTGDFLDATNFPNAVSYTIMGQNLNCSHWDFFGNGFQIDGTANAVGLVDPTLNGTGELLKKLVAGNVVGPLANYMAPGAGATAYHTEFSFSSPFGYCIPDNASTFFGFKIISGGQNYYGWMKVTRLFSDLVIIDEYAYDNTPNTAIIAGQTSTPVTAIAVTGAAGATTITIDNGTLQMNAAITPSNASVQTVTWSVVNGTGVATIDNSGLLTAVANGTVTVVATANDGSGVSGNIVITLSNQIALVQTIDIDGFGGASTINTAGGTLQMVAVIVPTYANNQTLTWSVIGGTGFGNINPATGLLTAVANGTVFIQAISTDGSNVTALDTITISNQAPTLATSILVSGTGGANTITTNLGTLQMLAAFTPYYTSNQNVTWSVVNGTGSATINASGLLTAAVDGTVTVIATAQDGSGVSGSMVVTISNQFVFLTSITVTSATGLSTINVSGGTLQMLASFLPTNASDTTIVWTVTNVTGSATISPTGLVTATGNGTVIVKATSQDGSGVSGTMNLTIINQIVYTLVSSITINSLTNTVVKNSTLQMYKTIAPATATVQNVNWSVINGSGTATITSSGLLTGTGIGVVTVLASALDTSNVVGSKIINVIPAASVGLEDFDLEKVTLSPNPFENMLTVAGLENQTFDYILFNNVGQVLQSGILNNANAHINFSAHALGNYFMQLSKENQVLKTYKLTKN